MKKYLVGGAIRNKLLNLPIKEKDWLIIGSTPEEMLKNGYYQVGKNFPVFIHPISHEEYALARTERKSGYGYKGFNFYYSSKVTLEEDLYRRDLTINAMACDENGNIIDPYDGQKDIRKRLLCHISYAFIEDPLRILRVGRFAAFLYHLNFKVASSTLSLMKSMIKELIYIPYERIWKETEKALLTYNPQIYFKILHNCGALKFILPEIDIFFKKNGIENENNKNNISIFYLLPNDINIRFIAFCYYLIQKINNYNIKNKNNHFLNTKKVIISLCENLKIPNNLTEITQIFIKYQLLIKNIKQLTSEKLIKLLSIFDIWRKPKRINYITSLNNILNYSNINYYVILKENYMFLYEAYYITRNINVHKIIIKGIKGKQIKNKIYILRQDILNFWKII